MCSTLAMCAVLLMVASAAPFGDFFQKPFKKMIEGGSNPFEEMMSMGSQNPITQFFQQSDMMEPNMQNAQGFMNQFNKACKEAWDQMTKQSQEAATAFKDQMEKAIASKDQNQIKMMMEEAQKFMNKGA